MQLCGPNDRRYGSSFICHLRQSGLARVFGELLRVSGHCGWAGQGRGGGRGARDGHSFGGQGQMTPI